MKAPVSLVRGSFHVVFDSATSHQVSLDVENDLDSTSDHRRMEYNVDPLCIESPEPKPKPRVAGCVAQMTNIDSPPGLPLRRCSFEPGREGTASPTSAMMFLDMDVTKELTLLLDDENDKSKKPTKQVRFLVDRNGQVDGEVSVRSFACHELTPTDVSNGWYSRSELRQMKFDVPLECRELIRTLPDYYDAAVNVCTVAARVEYETILEEHWESLAMVVDGEVRGLERPLLYRLNLPRSPSKRIASAVLSTQSAIRTLATEEDTEEEIAALIAKQYTFNSRYAIRWALILAAGDAIEARAYCTGQD